MFTLLKPCSRRRSTVLGLAVVLAVSFLFTSENVFGEPTLGERYYNDNYGFSIYIPKEWTINDGSVYAAQFLGPYDDELHGTINIAIHVERADDLSLQGYFDEMLAGQHGLKNFNLISQNESIKAGYACKEIVYTASTTKGYTMKVMDTYFVENGNAFLIYYVASPSSYDTYFPSVEQSLQTFNAHASSDFPVALLVGLISVGAFIGGGGYLLAKRSAKSKTKLAQSSRGVLDVVSSSVTPLNASSTEVELNELQRTADYYAFQKAIRTSWRTHIILGVMGIVLGLFYMQILSSINLILALIGLLLVIAGIRARTAPTRSSLLLTGITLAIAGAWILTVPFINLFTLIFSSHGNLSSFLPIIITSSLFFGVGFFMDAKKPLSMYRHYYVNAPIKPADEKLLEMEKLTKSIFKANISDNAKADPSILLFLRTNPSNLYRIKLNKTSAMIVSKDKSEIIFARQEEFKIVDKGKPHSFQQPHNIEIQIRGAKYAEGLLWPLYLQRYETWRNATHTPN